MHYFLQRQDAATGV